MHAALHALHRYPCHAATCCLLYVPLWRTLEQFFKKLEEEMAEVAMERHGHAKQLVVW
ncbi:hypothetical protein HaLaN_25089 [Haematococcus lacustris]|uniref:Uncharacterized protein n=1 Tax=Haematococcus lacustris TaxID=44745 RepID=A0A699ZZP0_HAELA|nr:hypothetical protein HaLaN_25089 [Haematococcus lacustris]